MNPAEVANEIIEILNSEISGMDDLGQRIVANRLAEVIQPYLPIMLHSTAPEVKDIPMTDAEAKAYGQTKLEFGKFANVRIDATPMSYLTWLCDESRSTWKRLHRYLNSSRIKHERDQAGL